MRDVFDYAKYFIKKQLGADSNTFDSNMKLQKLLFFANMINMAKYDTPLFKEDIYAFENGCVVEEVRNRYKYNYLEFCTDSYKFEPNFTNEEYSTLNDTVAILGHLNARELSDLNHTFDFWKDSLDKSKESRYYNKQLAIINEEDMKKELYKVQKMLTGYHESSKYCMNEEKVNGVTFFYDPQEITIDDEIIQHLVMFSYCSEDNAYTIYKEEGELVIY